MSYQDKVMLRDKGGYLIPQYWDEIDNEFKPLTNQIKIAGATDDGSGTLGVSVKEQMIMAPVDIQSRYAQTIQTHNAVSVASNSWSQQSNFSESDGFDKVAISIKISEDVEITLNVLWSHDGVNFHGEETLINKKSGSVRMVAEATVKAKYFKLTIKNGDASKSVTIDAYAYLKA